MSTTEDLKIARLLKKLFDTIYGLLWFACVALLLWIVLTPLISGQAGFLSTASVPVRIGVGGEPQVEVIFNGATEDTINAAVVKDAAGTLQLETDSVLLLLTANGAKFVAAIGLVYVFYLLRPIVQAIIDKDFFTAETGQTLRRLGYAVLLVGILRPTVEYWAAREILRRLSTAVPSLSPGPTFNAEVFLITLLIFFLAQIWSYGLDLERERALTI